LSSFLCWVALAVLTKLLSITLSTAEKGFTTVLACACSTTPLWIVDPVIMFVVDSVITAAQCSEIISSHWNELILSSYLLTIVLGIVLLNSWEQRRVFENHFWP
jgi:hypothetical protein